jgi:hypothetical protein
MQGSTKIEFIQHPMNYLLKMDGKMEEIKKIQFIYDSHFNGNPNQHLNQILMKKIENGKFKELFGINFFRNNSKTEFFKTIMNEKKKSSLPKEVKKLFFQLDEQFSEENPELKDEDKIHSLVLEKLFSDWVNETSPVMKQLDSMIDFKKFNEKIKIQMLEKVNKEKKPRMLFPEIEDAFKIVKSFQSMKYETEFDLFAQMNSKVEEMKEEIEKLKMENEMLKSINMKTMNPEIPHDAVFIGSDE